uniref:UBA domain-containing protein n=1 Tax=Anolis carolinensis TaxID=28377 RepID=A0A803TNC1_ANOCA
MVVLPHSLARSWKFLRCRKLVKLASVHKAVPKFPTRQMQLPFELLRSMFVLCFGTAADPAVPVFEMLYETNPVRSRFERRLEVSTQPLNIIYNPQAIRKVADFFYKGRVHTSGFGCQSELELRVAEAARRQYNKLKMQTKAEIRQTIDRLLVGDFIEDSKRWTVCLDISAPQVIFPDDFKFPDPVLVVIDLGRMLLTNSQEEHKKKSPGGPSSELSDLSDDEYKTPLATPPSSPPPEAEAENKEFEFSGVEISEEQLQAHLMSKKMYDTYNLSFMDLQIMVGRVRDNWKYAQDIAVGPTHVVEKFNVHLQLERRLIYTSDPKYPGAVLSGHLPDLKIHINEDKIMALSNCFGRLTASESATASPSQSRKEAGSADLDQRGSLHSSVMNLTQSVMVVEQHTKEVLVESQLLLAEFQVNCMQLGVESNGRYISVLKVFGTNAHFIKRPYDAEVSLTVHGLLLVDTMQTYGSDFDLLVASHKNLSLDVPTGSLRDRRMHSPVGAPGEDGKFPGPASRVAPHDESLIKLEYQFVSTECPSMNLDSTLQVISVQMNNLDIILNPETIVELIGFLQKSFPKEKDHSSPQPLMTEAERHLSEHETFQFTHSQNTEVTVDIHWLNVLLLRTVTVMNGEKLGRKIATASVGGTKVNVSMGTKLDVNGSLGCLHLMDLTQDVKNQYVVSIGNTVRYENLIRDASCSRPAFLPFDDAGNLPDALSFTFTEQSKEECSLHLKMASLHYNHSAKFLKELSLSMDELEDNFRGMLKHAATRVTTVLATKTAEYSEMVSLFDTAPRSRDPFNLESGEGEESVPARSKTEPIKLILDVNIESPVVSIPRRPGSSELLVGHLGQISIRNFVAGEDNLRNDRLQVEIRDIRLYSLNSSHVTGKKESVSEVPHGSSVAGSSQEDPQFTRHDFFESLHKGHAFHILNNATIQFELEKIPVERDAELAFSADEDIEISSLMRIEGKFVNPLQVVLAKHVYEQVLQTLDNLVCNEDLTHPPSGFPSSKCPSSDSPSALIGSTSSDFSLERKENGLFSHSGFGTPTGKFAPSKETTPSFTQIQATFHLSELQVQLSGDLTLGAQGLVSLKFQDFDIEFAKDHPQTLSIQIALRSLLMEDLLEKNPDSQYKNLMVSRGAPKPSGLAHKEYLSQSCPSVSNAEYPDMPRSLPSHMEEAPNVFQFYQRPTWAPHKKLKEDEGLGCPLTPPPSPTANESHPPSGKSDFDDSLVHINVLLVDKKHPAFATSYGKISRSVDVDFNCLDVLITLQTWVVILDFFGIGSTAENHSMKSQPGDVQLTVKSEASASPALEAQDAVNTKVDLKVHSLSLVLNKATNELAKANVSKLITHVDMIEGDLSLHGSIGSLSLSDLTSHGELYRERFTTSGEEAFIFQVYKYGRPDPLLQRDCDVRISLRMASVRYVHTQRFQAEVVSFIQHFTQLQDVLGRQRAAIEGQMVRDQAQRSARVLLDIEAGAPVLLIPESSLSNHLIVANLGKLKVKNRFLFAGTAGTFSLKDKDSVQLSSPLGTPKHSMKKTPSADESKAASGTPEGLFMKSSSSGPNLNRLKSESVVGGATKPPKSPESPGKLPISGSEHVCLLDCIVVDLQDMDIFAAERFSREYSEATEEAQADLTFPSFVIRQAGGSLLTEPFRLKLQVERNLDKEISHVVPDISVHGILSSILCALDLDKYKLIRGLLENNLGEPIEEFMRPYDLQDPRIHTVLSGEVYTCMSFLIDMVNVSLELTNPQGKRGSLARFDFKKSKLLFESFSNQTKSINLVSHSMMAFDTRYAGQRATSGMPNVFHCIFQSSKNSTSQGAIQIELHYRSTKDSSFFTVVLNNLRVFLIFDWLVLVHDFLRTASEARKQPGPLRQRHSSSEAAVAVVPKAVKSGIVTKRSSLQLSAEKQLEVKINVTDTEFVVVEDMSCADTNAIILKGTTVLTYKPKLVDHPFSGSLSGIEVFSCRLGNEQETALSIIDPALIQVELVGSSSYPSGSGLLDAFNSEDFPPILEIQLQALDIRLSYNDVQLFLAIAKSIPGQTGSSSTVGGPCSSSTGTSVSTSPSGSTQAKEVSGLALDVTETSRHTLDPVLEVQLARLQELGFSLDDCRKALLDCQGQLKKAASWLFKNAEPLKCLPPDPNSRDSHGPSSALRWVSGLDVKAESICICFIDDCMDCDVPLAELTFSRLNFLQHLRTSPEGYAHFTLSGDYYNRELSGWEPFIEPWPCSVSWLQQSASRLHPPRLKLEVKAKHRLDINVTSVLLEQYTSTKQSWMEDYCKHENAAEETESEEWMGSSVDPPSFGQTEMKTPKRRQPFVPFALRNHTGCTLWFGTTNPEGYISTLPGSSVVFHWPRNDYDQLLCVRLMDVPNCIWSGGFEVNKNNSFHINMRDTLGRCYFLRVEITLKGATFRVSFSDTDQLPPPFRIDNFSKVPVVFSQHGVAEPRLSTEVKPGSSLDYAWDEPTLLPYVTLTVKGAGSSEVTCCMDNFQDSKQLYYENFIYIAATYTFSGLQEESGRPVASNKEVERAELVLDVSLKTQRVILKKKEPGKRSQLWRMTGAGMLCHEGSAVPHPPNKPSPPRSAESSMILDIAGLAAVTDNRYEPLMLRKPDRRRSTTQTWSFRDGKLVCGMHGLVVQVKGGLSGLRDGAEVVLGPDTAMEMLGPVPPEQQFVNQKMRPGSGVLVVRVIPDGPTRVLQITDFNQRRNDRFSYEGEELEQDLQRLKNPDTEQELEVQLKLEGGVGLSLVNKVPEELIFASFTGINVHFMQLSTSQVLELSIQDVQVDNQLLRTTQPFMLFLTPKSGESEAAETGPAVQLNAMKFPSKRPLTDIYKHLMITASKFTVQIEEKLFLKLLSFFGYDQTESEVESYDENVHERPADQGGAQKRYYFENLKISMPQIKLSVFTSSKLPLDLKALKSTLGFPLVRFEDAVINLDPFTRVHPYETKDFIINDILKHFQEELLSQAARILSSVDFLGNPMGLLNDVSEGVTGLIKYGNVGGLFRNVAHGVSNSAAKFTGTLSDGLGKTMDNRHQTEREYIRYHAATSGEHLVAGIQGLAHGILGGLTSVITSTVEGVKTEGGVSGFISGLGKGLVGTVTKPVAGALDFASETAQAVRETATLTGPRYCKSHRPWFILPLTSPGRIGVHSGSVSKVSGRRYCKSHRLCPILPQISPGCKMVHSGSVSEVWSISMSLGVSEGTTNPIVPGPSSPKPHQDVKWFIVGLCLKFGPYPWPMGLAVVSGSE